MGWGGVVAAGLAGALGGAGEGLAQVGVMEQKAEIERMRDERLAELNAKNRRDAANEDIANIPRKHAAESAAKAGTADIDAATAGKIEGARQTAISTARGNEFRTLPREVGGSIYDPTKPEGQRWDSPPKQEKALTEEEREVLRERADAYRAKAEADRAKAAGAGKAKEDKTNIKLAPLKDPSGAVIGVQDMNTGWRQIATEGTPERKGSEGFLGFGKKEGKPAVPPSTEWMDSETGRVLGDKEYRETFYPQQAAKRNLGAGIVNAGTGEPDRAPPKREASPPKKAAITPPAAAIDKLRKDPSLKDFFDQKYGEGAADRALAGR